MKKTTMHRNLIATRTRNQSVAAVALSCCVWLSTAGLLPVTAGVDPALQLPALVQAEHDHYTLSRIEFIGNENIPDSVLRRRTRSLREGDRFKRATLKQSLAALNRLRIVPVAIKDVQVHLDRKQKEIDLLIPIRERGRPR